MLAGNSIGSRIALEVALVEPKLVQGLLLYNAAAGINNKFTITDKLTPFYFKIFAIPIFTVLDLLLKNKSFAINLFDRVRDPLNIKSTLESVYVNKAACDDFLIDCIEDAAKDENSLDVFVEILTNDAGKTPDMFMESLNNVPIHFVWVSFLYSIYCGT